MVVIGHEGYLQPQSAEIHSRSDRSSLEGKSVSVRVLSPETSSKARLIVWIVVYPLVQNFRCVFGARRLAPDVLDCRDDRVLKIFQICCSSSAGMGTSSMFPSEASAAFAVAVFSWHPEA